MQNTGTFIMMLNFVIERAQIN